VGGAYGGFGQGTLLARRVHTLNLSALINPQLEDQTRACN